MDRSPGFGSITYDLIRPFQTRFRFGFTPYIVLNLAIYNNSLDRSTKSTTSHLFNSALSACKHRVSDSISLPSRGSFHLSLTVLLHYRSPRSIQAWRVVPPASNGVPRVPLYSGSCYVNLNFIYWTITIFGRASHHVLLFSLNRVCSPQPQMYFYFWFGLFRFRSPLLTKSIFLSSPVGTQMFQFPTSPNLYTIYSCTINWSFLTSQVSPFGFPRINVYLQLPVDYRSLSRPSSALGAKAFSLCSLQLNLYFISWFSF